jgi:SseB protein C-terminal domain/SseB protein N-terminal domain
VNASSRLFRPENDLEHALVAALRGDREQLLGALSEAELYLPAADAPPGERRVVAQAGDTVPLPFLELEGVRYVPAFTSLPRLAEFTAEGGPYLRIAGRVLASIWPEGCSLALNPGGAVGLALGPGEVSRIPRAAPPAEAGVTVGEPREEPTRLLETLSAFGERTPELRALYRALLRRRPDRRPEIVIGVAVENGEDGEDGEAELPELLAAAGRAAREAGFEAVAFLPIGGGAGGDVERFMLERTRPFWSRV